MRLLVEDGVGAVVLNSMWMPTWIGCNAVLLAKLEEELRPLIVGNPLSEQSLDDLNRKAIEHIQAKFPDVKGLWRVLDSLKFVEM